MPESVTTEQMNTRAALSRALFCPASVALIGASPDQARLASRPQRVLRRHGYTGTIIPINPRYAEICGDQAHASMHAVPGKIDHAFVMVPASAVPDVIADCCAAQVKVATLFTAGFAETGEKGRRRQDRMLTTARAAGLRILGPNCLGVVNVTGAVTLSANAAFEHEQFRPGGLSVISQSGSMLGGIVTRAQERGLGFSKLVSVGNECDIGVGELVHLLVDDPDTRAILLFLEAFRDAPVLGAAARRAYAAGKPVIALKLGRSAIGREIATTHTGAMTGDDDITAAFFRAHGIIRVEVFEALFETVQFVLGHHPPDNRRVAALTVSGGAAALVVDRMGLAGVEIVPPPAEIINRLAANKIRISTAALTDLPMGRADGGAYAAILDELMGSHHCDAVVAVQGSAATYTPEVVGERILAARRGTKPLAVFAGPRADTALRILQEHGVAAFRTPEACADAVRAYCDWRAPTAELSVDPGQIASIHQAVRRWGRGVLNERAATCVLAAIGVTCVPSQVVRDGSEHVDLPFPVAAKILSADIPHKTDVDGVVLEIADARALSAVVTDLLTRVRARLPDARIDGVLVQPMQRGLGEVIVGYRLDREVGPIVMIGSGGIPAQLGEGRALRLAPVSSETAMEMITEVPELTLLRGYRNRPRGDLEALAQVVHLLSLLACTDAPAVLEAEINPLIVRTDGVVAVDALVRIDDV